ncbi:hypothetical protein B0H16DRAFT_1547998, partial [Mycena metata]
CPSHSPTTLFWILVFLITRQSGITQGHPDLLSRPSTEALCDCTINSCRSLFDIIWGCLATTFTCTWVALHQNVPDPELGWFSLLLRKLKMMLVTVIAPEVIVAFAARQLISALRISQEFNVSKTHGFFCTMGGFVSKEGYPVSRDKQLPVYMSAIRAIKEADIVDKSKGDTLSKGVALTQGLWFVTKCAARVSQHLPITELEVATLAFAVISTFIRLSWWWKPLDVQQPLIVVRHNVELDLDPLEGRPETAGTPTHDLVDRLFDMIGGPHDEYSPLSSTSVPSFYIAGVFGIGTIFGGIHCAAWNASFPSGAEMWTWRISSATIATYPIPIILITICGVVLDNALHADTLFVWLNSFLVIGTVVYIPSRFILIILPFTMLRAPPPRAFMDVNWSNYIPHL